MNIFLSIAIAAFIIALIIAIRVIQYNYRLKKGMKKIHEMMEHELAEGDLSPEDRVKFKAMSNLAKKMYEEIKITKPIEWED